MVIERDALRTLTIYVAEKGVYHNVRQLIFGPGGDNKTPPTSNGSA